MLAGLSRWEGTARTVAAEVLRRHAADVDLQQRYPAESVTALAQAGLMALPLVTALGGGAVPQRFRQLADVGAELGAACLSTALIWAMHTQQVAVLARHGGTAEQELLERVAEGRALIASVTTEAVKGGDLLRAHAPMQREADGWRLQRQAPVVSYGAQASTFLITMRRAADRPPNDVVLVRVERGDEGLLEVTGGWDAMGMRGTRSAPMRFDLGLPAERVLTLPFREAALQTMVPVGHLLWSAAWYGCAAGCLGDWLAALRDRPGARADKLASDLFLARLAELRLELDRVHGLIEVVARRLDEFESVGAPFGVYADTGFQLLVNNLKVSSARGALRVVEGLVEMVGMAQGYLRDSPLALERSLRDLRSASLMYHDDRLLHANGMLLLAGSVAAGS